MCVSPIAYKWLQKAIISCVREWREARNYVTVMPVFLCCTFSVPLYACFSIDNNVKFLNSNLATEFYIQNDHSYFFGRLRLFSMLLIFYIQIVSLRTNNRFSVKFDDLLWIWGRGTDQKMVTLSIWQCFFVFFFF